MTRIFVRNYFFLLCIALVSALVSSLVQTLWISRASLLDIFLTPSLYAFLLPADWFALIGLTIWGFKISHLKDSSLECWRLIFAGVYDGRSGGLLIALKAILAVLTVFTLQITISNIVTASAFACADLKNYELSEQIFSFIRDSQNRSRGKSICSLNYDWMPFEEPGMDDKLHRIMSTTYGVNSREAAEEDCRLADYQSRTNNVQSSENLYKRAINIFRETGAVGREAFATSRLADLLIFEHKEKEAQRYLSEAVRLLLACGDEEVQFTLLSDLQREGHFAEETLLLERDSRRFKQAKLRFMAAPDLSPLRLCIIVVFFLAFHLLEKMCLRTTRRRLLAELTGVLNESRELQILDKLSSIELACGNLQNADIYSRRLLEISLRRGFSAVEPGWCT